MEILVYIPVGSAYLAADRFRARPRRAPPPTPYRLITVPDTTCTWYPTNEGPCVHADKSMVISGKRKRIYIEVEIKKKSMRLLTKNNTYTLLLIINSACYVFRTTKLTRPCMAASMMPVPCRAQRPWDSETDIILKRKSKTL